MDNPTPMNIRAALTGLRLSIKDKQKASTFCKASGYRYMEDNHISVYSSLPVFKFCISRFIQLQMEHGLKFGSVSNTHRLYHECYHQCCIHVGLPRFLREWKYLLCKLDVLSFTSGRDSSGFYTHAVVHMPSLHPTLLYSTFLFSILFACLFL